MKEGSEDGREAGKEGGGMEGRKNMQSPRREGGGSFDNAPHYISMYALSLVPVYAWCDKAAEAC